MRPVDAKLAEWHEVYKRLGEARLRLATESAQPSTSWRLAELEKEVARLKALNDSALVEVHTLLERLPSERCAGPGSIATAARSHRNEAPLKTAWNRRREAFQQAVTSRWAER